MISKRELRNTDGEYDLYGCEQLANAVVKQAAVDYECALKRLIRHPHDIGALKIQNDCERFFQNEIEIYTTVDGMIIMNKIREKVRKETVS